MQLFREKLSEEVHATISKGIVGGFELTDLQRNLKEWHEKLAIDACLRVLKESEKSRFDSYYTVSGIVYWWDSMLPSGLTHAYFFRRSLSRNSCIYLILISIEITSFFKTINNWWSKSCFELTQYVTLIKVSFCFYFFNSVWLIQTLYASETYCYKNSSCLKRI